MKKLLLLAAVFLTSASAFSQSFTHGVGVVITVDKIRDLEARPGYGFTYSPRFNFAETENTSVSVGIPISLVVAASASYSAYSFNDEIYLDDDMSVGINFNAPVMANFNFGAGSSRENDSRLGGFVGAGFGLNWSANSDISSLDGEGNRVERTTGGTTFGPAANAGMRIGVGRRGKNIEIKLSYFKGLDDNELNLFGLSCLFNF
ncbi:hypothetical protein [Chitinophaga barathri]|uniref:Outer membrane protein beta-barrel domain-containing protein n=1 Tax=Chitinophaga barathri TaxID=1647451 RepID=A0A3N4MDL7_9BACT|nr:hypothetical protein [Chitinophaga barathri]RPD41658.1 hypothetical protein EG028_10160 [Chitinophaga barathri]